MKKILFFLIAVGCTQSLSAQKPNKNYSADSLLSRWVFDINLLGGLTSQAYTSANTLGNYPNALNANTGSLSFKNGFAYGADAQLGFFFGKKRHFGVGVGFMYMMQQGDATLDNFHIEYQSTDFKGSTFRQVVTGNNVKENLVMTNMNIPLLLKYKNRFSKRWGFTMDAGALINLQMKNAYTTNANFNYEAIYQFAPNGTAVYDNSPTPSVNDWMITKAEFLKNNPDGNYQAYVNAKRALGFNVGDGVSPSNRKGNISYKQGSIGFLVQPSFNYFLSDHVALNFGLYYMFQPFQNNAQTGYRLTDAVGAYSSSLNNVTKVTDQSYGLNIGARFFLGGPKKTAPVPAVVESAPVEIPVAIVDPRIDFSVRAPKIVSINRRVKETFPLRNSVFFDMGSSQIPDRYVMLSKSDASSFKEAQLQEGQPNNLSKGRSGRQLTVYYNILNVTGDRMRSNPQSTLLLTGSSDKNPKDGKVMAENVKQYLVDVYGIDPSRIRTKGRDKPVIASEEPGATKELTLLREGDRRVDIESRSPELLMEVGGSTSVFLKPVQISDVQEDPMDSKVLFNVTGASETLKSWSVDVTDEQGNVQHYGSYTGDQASVTGKSILGNNTQGNYTVVMHGETNNGHLIKKEASLSLIKMSDSKQEGLRYSILFDFDRSESIAAYRNFLINVVTPLIPENSTVNIHGHTDIIGGEKYNKNLSQERAVGVQQILETALSNVGKTGVKFDVLAFGKDEVNAPFENKLPEERFYNRTVIIDIIPAN